MVNGTTGEDVLKAVVEETIQELVHAHVIRFAQIYKHPIRL
jgi:hypothetical protein